jgi:hypothetical protein
MIIDDLDVFSAYVSPTKTDAKLIVDPDAMLARSISPEHLQMIAWRDSQVIQSTCDFQLP